jgi:class 3 adenylate cyclase
MENQYSESYLRWCAYLPSVALRTNPDAIIATACKSPTIVVLSDIRHSQDLMTYSISADDFSNRMVQFIMTTREIIEKHNGIFDKFTGDGFLSYFNEEICRIDGKNYIDCFLDFLREQSEFSKAHFREWGKSVKKLPEKPVGLAIGADLGVIEFRNINHHLIVVGDAVVWASRMAACALAEEILVNNLLYDKLLDRSDVLFEQRESRTKSGEGFLARLLSLK